jgi:hypothetical protein
METKKKCFEGSAKKTTIANELMSAIRLTHTLVVNYNEARTSKNSSIIQQNEILSLNEGKSH